MQSVRVFCYQDGGNAVVQPELCRCGGIRFLSGRIFAQIAHCILDSLAYNTLRARKNASKSFHLDEQGGCSHAATNTATPTETKQTAEQIPQPKEPTKGFDPDSIRAFLKKLTQKK